MKILHEYALSHLRENRKNSIFLFTAILIASMLISATGVFVHSQWLNEVDQVKAQAGEWQGHFREPVQKNALKYIEQNPQVEAIYIETQSQFLQLTGTKRPYIHLVGLNTNSLESPSIHKRLLEGRLPDKKGEIVLSQLFFKENPDIHIGDQLTLPAGKRLLNGKIVAGDAPVLSGEIFQASGEPSIMTITGSLNQTSPSAYPAYYAYGYLDMESPLPNEEYNVSAKLSDIRNAYEVFPQLAKNIGLKPNESGRVDIVYNTALLKLYGLNDPDGVSVGLPGYTLPLLLSLGLVALVFVVLIYNAFSVTSASRIRHLGILKSIGATPKQISHIIRYEAWILASCAVPAGILFGYGGMAMVIRGTSSLLQHDLDVPLRVHFSWKIVLLSLVAAFLTVLISAWGPSRRLSKMLPIEAVRNTPVERKLPKPRSRRGGYKWFGIEGELAWNALSAGRRAYRTTMLSLTLFIALIIGFQSFASIWMLDQKQTLSNKAYTLNISANIVDEPDSGMIEELAAIPGIRKQVMYRESYHTLLWDPGKLHSDFQALGGFREEDFNGWTNLSREGGQTQVFVDLIGFDAASFEDYCKMTGIDPTLFKGPTEHAAIIVNYTTGNNTALLDKHPIPAADYLKLTPGDTLSVNERAGMEAQELGSYGLKVGALTRQYPVLDQYFFPFDLVVIVPMGAYMDIVQNLNPQRGLEYLSVNYKADIPRKELAAAQEQAETILGKYLPQEDWSSVSLIEREASYARLMASIELLIGGFVVFLGVVGISGAFSAVTGNLQVRRREFAILRSAGLSPKGLSRLLLLESLMFGFIPMLLSLPLLIVTCTFILRSSNSVNWGSFLVHAPWGYLLSALSFSVGGVWLAYRITGSMIKKDNIIDAIRDERI
ncbi:FtsX-like permease family protein [Paenibacillus sp. sgz500958]|uniref:ABC transporter permease n=1 Tax=Paenibacillus sp. sgz500958 TaxID=3242475 RepID=UPI0036D3D1ED